MDKTQAALCLHPPTKLRETSAVGNIAAAGATSRGNTPFTLASAIDDTTTISAYPISYQDVIEEKLERLVDAHIGFKEEK